MKRQPIYILLALVLLLAIASAQIKVIKINDDVTYIRLSVAGLRFVAFHSPSGYHFALGSDFGGIDSDGLFVCPARWNQFPYETDSPFRFLLPVWQYIPVADC